MQAGGQEVGHITFSSYGYSVGKTFPGRLAMRSTLILALALICQTSAAEEFKTVEVQYYHSNDFFRIILGSPDADAAASKQYKKEQLKFAAGSGEVAISTDAHGPCSWFLGGQREKQYTFADAFLQLHYGKRSRELIEEYNQMGKVSV